MNDLISRKYLYDKMLEKEELARQRVLDTPTHSPAYLRYVAQLNERTALKHEIADAPDVTDTNVGSKWIPCSERLPENYGNVIACFSTGTVTELLYKGGGLFQGIYEYSTNVIIAWMPLPEPYKGERHETD